MFMVYYPCAVGIHYIYIYQVITDVMEKAKNGYLIKQNYPQSVHYPKLYNMAHLSLNILLLPKDLTIIFYLIKHRKKCKAIKILSFYLMQLLFYATFALFNHH